MKGACSVTRAAVAESEAGSGFGSWASRWRCYVSQNEMLEELYAHISHCELALRGLLLLPLLGRRSSSRCNWKKTTGCWISKQPLLVLLIFGEPLHRSWMPKKDQKGRRRKQRS